MPLSPEEERRAFSIWLRTGRRAARRESPVEKKYNHWHDTRDGRFTTSGNGRHDGSWGGGGFTGGGGSGGYDGAGATGTWDDPLAKPRPQKQDPAKRGSPPRNRETTVAVGSTAPKSVRPVDRANAPLPPIRQTTSIRLIRRAGYEYQIDKAGRTSSVSGAITLADSTVRSRTMQRQAGGPDRRQTDDGGHFIAPRFNGPKETFNHFAQDANFNRGAYRVMEDGWAKAANAGKTVDVRIAVYYASSSRRPSSISVWYEIDGKNKLRSFPNERQDGNHGK